MSGKNLTFKLVMEGDSKGLVSAVKQSQEVTQKLFDSIKKEADQVRGSTSEAAKGIDDVGKKTAVAAGSVKYFGENLKSANIDLGKTETFTNQATTSLNGLKTTLTAVAAAATALGIGLGVRELAQAADSYTNLSARINIATNDGGNFQQAMAGVHQIALMTNTSLDATAGLFTKVNDVGKQIGLTQQQSLDLTKTINMAIQTGGGSAQASEAAIVQLTQALQSGVLRGDEFNSIMEQAPGISKALAQSLGVATDELRKMAENGELSAEKVIKALQDQSAAIEADYNKFPTTIGNALQRIATQWQILIGTMDQANGASATVAQWLVTLADNMDVVETILEDIGEGFIWVGDQLQKIDPATIEALKQALSTAYETLKSLVVSLGSMLGTTTQVLDTALSAIFDFNSGIDTATDKTNGLTKALQAADVIFALFNDGFKGIAIIVNLFAGAMYEATGAFMYWKSKFMFGDAKAAAFKEFQDLTAEAKRLYGQADELALNHEVQVTQALDRIGKTREQNNDEAVASETATFAELVKKNTEFTQKSKELAGERAAIDAQLNQARKDGNQSTIDAIIQKSNELEGREKEHAANRASLDKDMLASAQAYAEAAIKANGGVMDGVMQADLMTKGYIVTMDQAGKVSVEAWQKNADAATGAVNEADRARKAAVALGIDLDNALNRVSEKFTTGKTNLDSFAVGMEDLGLKGEAATNALYLGWSKWLETAKNQAEIDVAKIRLQDFSKTGQLSAKQVEIGLQAVKRAAQELPDSISPVEAAFERLGIKTKEQLKLSAELALNDFNTIMKSGEATQEGLQKAYEETIRLAYASGDAQVIAAANAKAAYLGLEVQLDATGKATVAKLGEMQQAAVATQRTIQQVSNTSSSSSSVSSDEKSDDDDYWEEFKQKMADRTAKSNAAAQARRSSIGGVKAPIGTDSALMAQPVIPDAPMIASGFDIKPIEGATPTQTVEIKIDMGTGQTATVNAAPDQADALTQMMRELEKIKRSS